MKNLFDVIEKSKKAKRSGKEFEYPGTSVVFEIRPLGLTELSILTGEVVTEDKEKLHSIASQIGKIFDMDIIINWKNMTLGDWTKIGHFDDKLTEEEAGEEVPFVPECSKGALMTLADVDESGQIKNADFALFIANAVYAATNERNESINKQKKM